jgi:hypothetical protein
MMTTLKPVEQIPPLQRPETIMLAAAENGRILEPLNSLDDTN